MNRKIAVALFLLSLLTACGGGGGSSAGSGGGGTTGGGGSGSGGGTTNTSWEPAVTSVPAATYTGDNLTIYAGINTVRAAAGAGLLTQNTQLDQAAAAHAQYVLQNWSASTLQNFHDETSGSAGFTGATPNAQMSAAGYTGNPLSQIGVAGVQGNPGLTAASCVNTWLDSVYHSGALFDQATQVGIAFASDSAGDVVCVVDLGTTFKSTTMYVGQLPATTLTYPYANATNVQTSFYPVLEYPNPDASVGTNAIGQPILVWANDAAMASALPNGWQATQVTINAFTVTAQGSNAPIAAQIVVPIGTVGAAGVTVANDPADFSGLAYVLPAAPLSPNTTYNAVFSATVAGQAVNVSWSFTTGTSSGV